MTRLQATCYKYVLTIWRNNLEIYIDIMFFYLLTDKCLILLFTCQKLKGGKTNCSIIFQAWARLCKCLGQDFLPYMNVVMPPLLQSAQLKPDVTITSADSDDDIDEDDERFPFFLVLNWIWLFLILWDLCLGFLLLYHLAWFVFLFIF